MALSLLICSSSLAQQQQQQQKQQKQQQQQEQQAQQLSVQMANKALEVFADNQVYGTNSNGAKWSYDMGVVLEGMTEVWRNTANPIYFNFIQQKIDDYVQDNGTIFNYKKLDYNIDNVKNGRSLLLLYKVTKKEKYLKAAQLLFNQLKEQPRTKEGGFWHKKIYPNQMWLDGLYMAQPFYTEYAALLNDTEVFEDVVNQFVYMEKNARDTKNGLLFHAWDESREQAWADAKTGRSPHIWARGMGWFSMALVDVLDYFPEEHPRRAELLHILKRTAEAIVQVQDKKTGVWFDILDLPKRKGNYLEASASSMFVYALAKGIRKGYLPASYLPNVEHGFHGLKKEFVTADGTDKVDLNRIVQVSGLGGEKKYRDGSFEYYMSEPIVTNDAKGVGPFILAAAEWEYLQAPKLGKGMTVVLDNYYNREFKKDISGRFMPYHYLFDGEDNNGFSFLGKMFERHGLKTETLRQAPTAKNLQGKAIYLIVDPDTEKETAEPHFMNEKDAAEISQWVYNGGTLLLLLNDVGNAELDKFNLLTEKFGIHIHADSWNRVEGKAFEQGAVLIPEQHPIFKETKKLYLKEVCTFGLQAAAQPILEKDSQVLMALSKFGKGMVFAVGDPWLYNEYVDGRKLPPSFENFKAGHELIHWLIKNSAAYENR